MVVWFIALMLVAFGWLAYETRFLSVRLPCCSRVASYTPPLYVELPKGYYGDWHCGLCNKEFSGEQPIRVITDKYWGGLFPCWVKLETCDDCATKILKQIEDAQNGKKHRVKYPSYPRSTEGIGQPYNSELVVLFDGQEIGTFSQFDKRGDVKVAMSDHLVGKGKWKFCKEA